MFEPMSLKTKALSVFVPMLLIIKSIGCFEALKLIKQEPKLPRFKLCGYVEEK